MVEKLTGNARASALARLAGWSDVKDRDATEPNVLIDTAYRGKPSKLLLHADRNGFFYVLDRISGALLLAKPFLRRVDWASAIGAEGRPVVTFADGHAVDHHVAGRFVVFDLPAAAATAADWAVIW